jgi:hypothetical protein
MTFWRRLAQNRLLDVGAGLIAILAIWRIAAVLPARARTYDFAHYYTASHLLWEGRNPYQDTLEPLMQQTGFIIDPYALKQMAVNAPLFVWALAPLAALGPVAAFWGWVMIQAGSLAVVLWLTCRLLGNRLTPRARWFVVTLTVASTPVYWHFYFSQMQLPLAALLLAAFAQRQAGRPVVAGLLVTVAGLLKMFPFVLLPWFVWRGPRRWHCAGAAAALAAVIVLATDPGKWGQAYRQQREVVELFMANQLFNETVPSLILNLTGAGMRPLAVGAGLLLIAAAYWRCGRAGFDESRQFALLTAALLAGIPYAWGHYLVLLIFPVALVASTVPGRGWWLVAVVAALNNLGRINFMLDDPWLAGHWWWKLVLNYVPLAGLLATGGLLWYERQTASA